MRDATTDNFSFLQEQFTRMIRHIHDTPLRNTDPTLSWKMFQEGTISTGSAPSGPPSTKEKLLLLGPWGCGAFAPTIDRFKSAYISWVARQFKTVLESLPQKYTICFVFLDSDENYDIFRRVFTTFTEM
jgi:hypothetical protein